MLRALRAFSYPFAGLRQVWGNPKLRSLAWPPVLFFVVAAAAGTWAAVSLFDDLSAAVWGRPEGALLVLWYPLQVVLALVMALGTVFAVLVVQAIFTAPWNDALSERVERLRTGQEPPALSLRLIWKEVVRTVRIELGKIALYLGVTLPLWIVSLAVPGVGQVVAAAAGWVLTALFLAFDYMDWPMARRGWGFRKRLAFFRRDLGSALGFGTGCWVLLLVPFVNILFVPAAVAGGTNLLLDLETGRPGEKGASRRGEKGVRSRA